MENDGNPEVVRTQKEGFHGDLYVGKATALGHAPCRGGGIRTLSVRNFNISTIVLELEFLRKIASQEFIMQSSSLLFSFYLV